MITASDSFVTFDIGNYYVILPTDGSIQQHYQEVGRSLKPVPPGFAYNSGSNPEFLTVEQLRELIRKYVDPDFQPV